jgi:SNF2 family DNA or RNA helicase
MTDNYPKYREGLVQSGMQKLHAHYSPKVQGLFFWLETTDLAEPVFARGRPAKNPKPKPHPYCAAPAFEGKKHTVCLSLPATRGFPLPSPGLIHPWDIPDTNPSLAPFMIEGVRLPPEKALPILLAFSKPHLGGRNIYTPSPTLQYWRMVASLILESLAHQKYVPVVDKKDAHWSPVLDTPEDAARITQLITAMPPICRAETPDYLPETLLNLFINSFCDALIRCWGKSACPEFNHKNNKPAQAWLEALFSENPSLDLSPNQLEELTLRHNAWMRNLHVAGDAIFRVAFLLEAPPLQEDPWQLQYLIQAKDDPSLLIPADEVWKKSHGALHHLDHRFEKPQERLLAGLGYAARLFPAITTSLKNKRPTELMLDTQSAYVFLQETAPLLEGAGFGILIPPWWNKKKSRIGVKVRMKPQSSNIAFGQMTMKNLINYQWQLSLGETALTEEEFMALAKIKSGLVHIRGQWVSLNMAEVEAAIKFWKKQSLKETTSLNEALRLGLGAENSVGGLEIKSVDAEGWLADWLEQLTQSQKMDPLPQPKEMAGELRAYQVYGYSWLAFLRQFGLGACLADDMGLGKTIQTIALLVREKALMGHLPAPTLLIAPTSVVTNWEREIERFAPGFQTYIHRGPNRLKDDSFQDAIKDQDIILTSYPVVRRDADFIQSTKWHAVILDEAQNIKNPETQQTRVIQKIESDFRVALTGTPVENRLSELWSIMQFLNPGFLGSRKAFGENYALPIERYQDKDALEKLKQLTTPFILRRVKTDPTVISDLPEKVESKVYCVLTEEQATLYEAVVQNVMARVEEEEGIQRRGLVLSMLMQLKQICNHPVQYLHQPDASAMKGRSGKLERLGELLEEALSDDQRALIFTQFSEMGQRLAEYLPSELGVATQFLYGGTPTKQRDRMITRFQEDIHAPPVLILSLKAGGTGLNLTRANHVFHFDRWWNPAVEDQATDRAFRIGQKRNVQVHKFVCTGTLEEMIDDMIESKKDLAQSVVGRGENWLTEMSTEDLRNAVRLRRE